jgi:polynucleotide 5'-hydroxyl-kinase GRC3/NOL9
VLASIVIGYPLSLLSGRRRQNFMKLKLAMGHELLIHGPGTVRTVSGTANCLGMPLKIGDNFVVRAGRTKIVVATDETELELTIGQAGGVDEVDSPTIPSEWTDYVRKVVEKDQSSRIMVLGGLDTGKNTLITYVTNLLIKDGVKVALMDADMGQGEIGPPTTMSVATISEPISELLEMDPDSLFFVGSTSPMHLVSKVLEGTSKLMAFVNENAKDATLLVNMPGWITGPAAGYFIQQMASRTDTTNLAILQRENEVESVLGELPKRMQVTRLPVSSHAMPRSKEERKFLRETSYRKYLSRSSLIVARYESIDFSPLFLSRGKEATSQTVTKVGDAVRSKVLYCEEGRDFVNAIVTDYADTNTVVLSDKDQQEATERSGSEATVSSNQREMRVISRRELEYLLVALHGRGEEMVSLGVLKRLDFRGRRATIFAPINIRDIEMLEVGRVRVSPQGYELGHAEIHKILSQQLS